MLGVRSKQPDFMRSCCHALSLSLAPPSFFLLHHPSIHPTHTTSSEFTEIYFAYHIPYSFQVDNQWFLVNLSHCAGITIKHKGDRTFLSSQWEPSYPLLILASHPRTAPGNRQSFCLNKFSFNRKHIQCRLYSSHIPCIS